MSKSKEKAGKALLWLAIAFSLPGIMATQCGKGTGEDSADNVRQQLWLLWVVGPHADAACIDDSASIPLLTDGTVQNFTTGPRETVFHFATGANGAQVTVTNVGPCDLSSSYFRCDRDGYLRGDAAGISCVPAASVVSGTGASRVCTFSQSNVRIVPWYGGAPQGCAYQVKVVHL